MLALDESWRQEWGQNEELLSTSSAHPGQGSLMDADRSVHHLSPSTVEASQGPIGVAFCCPLRASHSVPKLSIEKRTCLLYNILLIPF